MEPINQLKFFFDSGNVILSAIAVILIGIVVMKTEKELKRSFELFFIAFFVLFISSVFEMDKYIGVISSMQAKWVLIVSRFIGLIFITWASLVMAKLVKKQIKCVRPQEEEPEK